MRTEARAAGSEGSKPSSVTGLGPRMAERRPERPLEHQSSEPVRVALGASSVSFQVSRLPDRAAQTCGQGVTHRRQGGAVQRAAEEVGIAAFDAICSAQKDRRLGASDLTLPYPTLPYLRKVRTRVQFGVVTGGNAVVTWGCVRGDTSRALSCRPLCVCPAVLACASRSQSHGNGRLGDAQVCGRCKYRALLH